MKLKEPIRKLSNLICRRSDSNPRYMGLYEDILSLPSAESRICYGNWVLEEAIRNYVSGISFSEW